MPENSENGSDPTQDLNKNSPMPFPVQDVGISEIVANTTHITLGNSEVSIYFGTTNDITSMTTPSVRVIIPQYHFVKMMEHWAKYYDFLMNVYEGYPPSLNTVDPELLAENLGILFGKGQEDEATSE